MGIKHTSFQPRESSFTTIQRQLTQKARGSTCVAAVALKRVAASHAILSLGPVRLAPNETN